ncbi:acyl-CoA dehydrogenase [Candidatus Woesearchaeota archaeon]|nr:acyl-CoA dehydrogenase [Candidatus Woesearchaeota archaeon]
MDFKLSDEHLELQQRARKFATEVVAPAAAHHDRTGEFPFKIAKIAHAEGLLNSLVEKKFGGPERGSLATCIIAEEISAACSGIGIALDANALAQGPVLIAGNDDQKRRFLQPMIEKPTFASYAVTEPDAGSDVSRLSTTATRIDDKTYSINGLKWWITGGAVASWYFVLAKAEGGATGFIVPADTPGIIRGVKEENLGQHASNTVRVAFEDVRVPIENRLLNEGDGFKIAMKTFDYSRPLVAAAAVGVARSALEHATKYAKRRKTFGKKIIKYQGVSFKLADMAMHVETARLLTWKSAWLYDQGLPNTKESAMAKAYAADYCMQATIDAVQIMGGYGYSMEVPMEKLMRDAKIFQIYEGTSEIQRTIIVSSLMRGR